jgi:hypothetical protein
VPPLFVVVPATSPASDRAMATASSSAHTTAAAALARQAADDLKGGVNLVLLLNVSFFSEPIATYNIKDGNDAVNNEHDDGANGIGNAHQDGPNGLADAFELKRGVLTKSGYENCKGDNRVNIHKTKQRPC